jgi:hypothetical protein
MFMFGGAATTGVGHGSSCSSVPASTRLVGAYVRTGFQWTTLYLKLYLDVDAVNPVLPLLSLYMTVYVVL